MSKPAQGEIRFYTFVDADPSRSGLIVELGWGYRMCCETFYTQMEDMNKRELTFEEASTRQSHGQPMLNITMTYVSVWKPQECKDSTDSLYLIL